jgi:Tumour suppressing sub-chromosomal transferable candidate 4
MADHRRNPQSWTKYSLADVTTDQLSDRSNTSAALDFLKQLRRRNAAAAAEARKHSSEAMEVEWEEEVEEVPADLSQPITFRKPTDASGGGKSRPRTGTVRPSPSLITAVDEDKEESDNNAAAIVVRSRKVRTIVVEEESSGDTSEQPVVFRKIESKRSGGSRVRNLQNESSQAADEPTAVTVEEEKTAVVGTAVDTDVTSGASGGENKKLAKKAGGKSAKSVMLSHLDDEEDE